MRVTVDENLCEANGFCESLASDVFELGDEDVVQIADGPVPPDRAPNIVAAAPSAATLPQSPRVLRSWGSIPRRLFAEIAGWRRLVNRGRVMSNLCRSVITSVNDD